MSDATQESPPRLRRFVAFAAALLVGLAANAAAGWWWADPVVALLIAGVAVPEARDAWRGEQCDCC
jgi:fatty acid desaturase